MVREISITEIEGVRIGNAQNADAKTGVTVLLFAQGAKVGVDISGGGPASRETPLASPLTADNPVHAIVLSGGWRSGEWDMRPVTQKYRWYASPVSTTWDAAGRTSARMRIWAMQPAQMQKKIGR